MNGPNSHYELGKTITWIQINLINVCLFSWSLIVRLQAGLIFDVIVVIVVVVVRVFLAGTAVMGLMGEMVFLALMATKDQRFVSFVYIKTISPSPLLLLGYAGIFVCFPIFRENLEEMVYLVWMAFLVLTEGEGYLDLGYVCTGQSAGCAGHRL